MLDLDGVVTGNRDSKQRKIRLVTARSLEPNLELKLATNLFTV